jgi:glycerol-3-phosphate acyltransferase PlsY
LAGLAAIVGHLAPPWLRFKGGKGVATSAGVFLALAPLATLAALGVFAVVIALSRMVSLGSLAAAVVLPVAYASWPPAGASLPDPTLVLCGIAAVLVVVRHRENVKRIVAGTEPRLWGNRK